MTSVRRDGSRLHVDQIAAALFVDDRQPIARPLSHLGDEDVLHVFFHAGIVGDVVDLERPELAAGADIDGRDVTAVLAEPARSWRRASENTRPDGSFEEAEQLVWNEAGA